MLWLSFLHSLNTLFANLLSSNLFVCSLSHCLDGLFAPTVVPFLCSQFLEAHEELLTVPWDPEGFLGALKIVIEIWQLLTIFKSSLKSPLVVLLAKSDVSSKQCSKTFHAKLLLTYMTLHLQQYWMQNKDPLSGGSSQCHTSLLVLVFP